MRSLYILCLVNVFVLALAGPVQSMRKELSLEDIREGKVTLGYSLPIQEPAPTTQRSSSRTMVYGIGADYSLRWNPSFEYSYINLQPQRNLNQGTVTRNSVLSKPVHKVFLTKVSTGLRVIFCYFFRRLCFAINFYFL